MTIIVTLNGPILYRAIWDDIGGFWAISADIGVIYSSVESVMYLARPIQVVPGQLIFKLILSGRVGYMPLRYC